MSNAATRCPFGEALAAALPELAELGELAEAAAGSLAPLTALARVRTLKRDEALLRAGETWRDAFWVERGALRLFYIDSDGNEANKNFHLERALLWPITRALRDTPVRFFVTALEPSVVHCLPYAALENAAGLLPSWTSLQLAALGALLDDKMQREQSFLQDSARQRYENLLATRPEWAQRIALRHLASYLGMTDVSLSRLRAEMGLITR